MNQQIKKSLASNYTQVRSPNSVTTKHNWVRRVKNKDINIHISFTYKLCLEHVLFRYKHSCVHPDQSSQMYEASLSGSVQDCLCLKSTWSKQNLSSHKQRLVLVWWYTKSHVLEPVKFCRLSTLEPALFAFDDKPGNQFHSTCPHVHRKLC